MSSAANCVFQTLYMSVRQGFLVDIGFRPLRPEPATAAYSPWHGNLVLTLLHSPGFLLSLPAHWPLSPLPVINDPMCSQSHWLLPALLHATTVLQATAHLLLRFPSPTSDPGALSELWTSSWSRGGSRLWEPIRTGSPMGSWWLVQMPLLSRGVNWLRAWSVRSFWYTMVAWHQKAWSSPWARQGKWVLPVMQSMLKVIPSLIWEFKFENMKTRMARERNKGAGCLGLG